MTSFETLAINCHTGNNLGDSGDESESPNPVVPPIYYTSTFRVSDLSNPTNGYLYSRYRNPTREQLETTLAKLDNANHGLVFSSGMASIMAVIMSNLSSGDHVLVGDDCYGGVSRVTHEYLINMNISFDQVDILDIVTMMSKINSRTKMILFESVSNPMMKIADIDKIVNLTKDLNQDRNQSNKILIVIDNTFLTSYLLRPLDHGVDIVIHSLTKYINGHSDVVMGAVLTNQDTLYNKLKGTQFALGSIPSPMDCFLVQRGIKTLPLRMKKQSKNAIRVARFLENHHLVEKVIYPGLENHPQHEIITKLLPKKLYSGIITFQLKLNLIKMCDQDNKDKMKNQDKEVIKLVSEFLNHLKIFTLAVSLGSVESLVEVPFFLTQGCNNVSKLELEKRKINPGLIRLSIGIENPSDLISDLDQALKKLNVSISSLRPKINSFPAKSLNTHALSGHWSPSSIYGQVVSK